MKDLAASNEFAAAHLAPSPFQFNPEYGHMATIGYGAGKYAKAFVVPPAKSSKVGIILIHEWWGLNGYIKREAERLYRATGYGVVAVDLFAGKVAQTAEQASSYVQMVKDSDARGILRAAVAGLKTSELMGRKMNKVGTIGFCFGGGWSLQTALIAPKSVNACVMYYGMPETDPAKLKRLSSPVLANFAEKDNFITPAIVSKFEKLMVSLKKKLEVRMYPATHAFANPSNPAYDQENADKAWKATLAFFKRTLGQ